VATKPKLLLAVMSCVPNRRTRVRNQRDTWLTPHPDIDIRVFYGGQGPDGEMLPDEVHLKAPDDYENFPMKVRAMFAWALDNGYDWVFKTDDDTFGVLDRLAKAYPQTLNTHYAGRVRGPSGNKPAPYASGFGYWLDRTAMKIVAESKWDFDFAEDRWVANLLFAHGISPERDYRYAVVNSKRNAISYREGPRSNNGIILSCEYETADMMKLAQHEWLSLLSSRPECSIPEGSLSNVTVLIRTFLRDGYLNTALNSLEPNYRSAKFLIVDDGWHDKAKFQRYSDLRMYGHDVEVMPFDSGFGAKSNMLLTKLDREFVLIGSDDFNFTPESRRGVEAMLNVMHARPDIGWVGGRVNNKPYEGNFAFSEDVVKETQLDFSTMQQVNGVKYAECDLTVNWGLLRRECLKSIHWCPEWKIGGDHFNFFDALKRSGWLAAVVPSASIDALPNVPSWKLSAYDSMRARAWEALPGFFKNRGIRKYILFDGSYDELRGDVLVHCRPDGLVTHSIPVTTENSTVKCDVCGYRRTL
jgi:hypothetical protein